MHRDDHIKELLKGDFNLDIPNFQKWNPDTRYRRSWFALSTDWWIDPKVAKLTNFERGLWLVLLSLRAGSGKVLKGITLGWIQDRAGFRGGSYQVAILKLLKLGLIDLRCHSLQDKQDKQEEQPFDEEALKPKEALPVKTTFSSSAPPGPGRPFFEEFDPVSRGILEQYEVTERGLEAWVRLWGVETIAANLPRAVERFENGANVRNPHYRNNFLIYFRTWMENLENKKRSKRERDAAEAEAQIKNEENEQWKAY